MGGANLWPVGVAIYISGTVGESLGANLQRRSLTTEQSKAEEDPSYEMPAKMSQRMWMWGFVLFVGAGIGMSVALFFASQTMLAPLQLFLFLFNAVFANVINREPFSWLGYDGLATFLVMAGVVMAVVSAPKVNHEYSDEEMIDLMKQPGFISFCCVAFVFLVALYAAKRYILHSCKGEPRSIPHQRRYLRTVLNMSYGALAGAFGGVNVTLTKTVFSLIVGQYQDSGLAGVLTSPLLYGTGFVLVATYVLQILVTVNGLEVASAIIVISAHAVTEEVVATLGGILYFQDYKHFQPWQWGVFMSGTALAIFAVVLLSHLRLAVVEAAEEKRRISLLEQGMGSNKINSSFNKIISSPAHSTPRPRTTSGDSNYSYSSLTRKQDNDVLDHFSDEETQTTTTTKPQNPFHENDDENTKSQNAVLVDDSGLRRRSNSSTNSPNSRAGAAIAGTNACTNSAQETFDIGIDGSNDTC
mmetsp:Transcript_14330/g.19595  ORF Transcript_14330/g.19595 Transcript_14330/m.19595 type:complete len:471 (-) Transcript_14330:304-1716(-)|eukprot:CAMPEP_0185733730 /NCGR_PEP_ID=MMETSP1171-20130828/20380_1 /TAXON_ID=374046 /ORGANISM="Helicotheca tamensis, Strain CCMP826" /LENGTH=470 /DNA_ID=CAMNT_0028403529 /DNA_START=362 /DNA_END=1774 /DNA_ORIENTATION=+